MFGVADRSDRPRDHDFCCGVCYGGCHSCAAKRTHKR